MSHELNHLLPFKTLMTQITISAAFLGKDFVTNVILFREILKLCIGQNGFLSSLVQRDAAK